MSARRACSLTRAVLVAALVMMAAPAHAAPKPPAAAPRCAKKIDPAKLPAAKVLSNRGKEAYEAGRSQEAIELFERAYCMLPAAPFRYNISRAYRKLNRCEQAFEYANLWVNEADEADKADARKWLIQLQGECARVRIETDPAGGQLWLDAEAGDPIGTAPWDGWVVAGTHTVLAHHDGFLDEHAELIVPEGTHPPIRLQVAFLPVPPAAALAPPVAPPPPPVVVAPPSPPPAVVVPPSPHVQLGQDAMQQGNYPKAAKEFDAALLDRPGDPDVLRLQSQNLLKFLEYNKVVASLEQAQAAAPDSGDVAEQLAKLYASTDQRAKAAAAQVRADRAAELERQAARKRIKPDEIKTVSVALAFRPMVVTAPTANDAYLSQALPWLVARDLARSAHVTVVAPSAAAVTYVVDGQYLVVPPQPGQPAEAQLQVVARLLDAKTQAVVRNSARNGPVEDVSRIQHAVALDLLDQFVPLTEHERKAIADALPISSVESLRLLTAGEDAVAKGELLPAIGLLKRARAADEGNAIAIEEYRQVKQELTGGSVRVTVEALTQAGPGQGLLGANIRSALMTRLAQSGHLWILDPETGAKPEDKPAWLPADVVVGGTYELTDTTLAMRVRGVDQETNEETFTESVSGAASKSADLQAELAARIARRLGATDAEARKMGPAPVEPPTPPKVATPVPPVTPAQAPPAPPVAAAPVVPPTPAPTPVPVPAPVVATPKPAAPEPKPAPAQPKPAVEETKSSDLYRVALRWQGLGQKHGPPPLGLDFTLATRTLAASGAASLHLSWVLGAVRNTRGSSDAQSIALYDTGADLELDFLWGGIGFNLGLAGTLGMVKTVGTPQFFYGVRPRGGVTVQSGALQLTGDIGAQIAASPQLDPNGPTPYGLFAQIGASYGFGHDVKVPSGMEIGYRAHFVLPDGANASKTYGGLTSPGGVTVQHELVIGKAEETTTQSFVLGLASIKANAADGRTKGFSMQEFGWDGQSLVFAERHRLNPLMGLRVSIVRASGDYTECFAAPGCIGLVVAPRLGVDLHVAGGLHLQAAYGYDFQVSPLTMSQFKLSFTSRNNFSGLFLDMGLLFRIE